MFRDGCVYMKEADGDDNEYCFKPSSTYTAECQDDGVTGEQGVELPGEFFHFSFIGLILIKLRFHKLVI